MSTVKQNILTLLEGYLNYYKDGMFCSWQEAVIGVDIITDLITKIKEVPDNVTILSYNSCTDPKDVVEMHNKLNSVMGDIVTLPNDYKLSHDVSVEQLEELREYIDELIKERKEYDKRNV